MPRPTATNAWGKSRRAPKRAAWTHRPRRSVAAEGLEDPAWAKADDTARDTEVEEEISTEKMLKASSKLSQAAFWRERMLWRARRLWSDYELMLEIEKHERPDIRQKVIELYREHTSSYRRRLHDPEAIVKYDQKTERIVRDTTATARRRENQLDVPFSVDARTGSYMNQRIARRAWEDQQHGLRILHHTSAEAVLEAMMEVIPRAPFVINPHVSVFGADQCYHMQSASTKRGERRGAERLNANGMPIYLRSETVLNIVERQIPFNNPLLTPAEVQLIADKGPYTQDPHVVESLLDPVAVERNKWAWVASLMQLVAPGAGQPPPLVAQLPTTESEVVDRVLGKPAARPPGRSAYKIQPSVQQCATQYHDDAFKMWPILLALCAKTVLVVVIFCDGQLVELLRACKMRWPEYFKRVLIGNGFLHAMAHFCFCLITGYWKARPVPHSLLQSVVCSHGTLRFARAQCILCTFARWLHKDKQIYEHMKDMQHDNARHALDFHRVSVAGILAFLLLDVQRPPPRMLISDPRGYCAAVRNAGGTVILMYLFNAGIPVVTFHRAIRGGAGHILSQLVAFAFHCHRALAEKFKSVYIAITCLMGLATAHPKLIKVLEDYCIISLLGKTWIAMDHGLEHINMLQMKRGTAFKSMDSQLHFTSLLSALIQVDTAWQEADGHGSHDVRPTRGPNPTAASHLINARSRHRGQDDGIKPYLRNDIAAIRRNLRATLGTDLTKEVPGNALWHTGNAVPLDGHDYRERKPQEYVDEVMYGRSIGRGRGNKMHWRVFVRQFISEHWPRNV